MVGDEDDDEEEVQSQNEQRGAHVRDDEAMEDDSWSIADLRMGAMPDDEIPSIHEVRNLLTLMHRKWVRPDVGVTIRAGGCGNPRDGILPCVGDL